MDGLLAEVTAEAQKEEQAALAELTAIALDFGPEQLFTTILIMLCLVPEGTETEATHGAVSVKTELLAYHLFPLFGNRPKGPLKPPEVERTFALVDTLFRSYLMPKHDTNGSGTTPDVKAVVGHVLIEARVVRGSAYPEQTMQEILELQGQFEEWFSRRVGIGPRRAIQLLKAILQAEEDRANEWREKLRDGRIQKEKAWKEAKQTKKSELNAEQKALLSNARSSGQAGYLGYAETLATVLPDDVPVPREFVRFSPAPTEDEWQGLISLIGCTPETRKQMQYAVEMQQRPLYVLPNDRLLLCDSSNAADQVWRAFEDIARQDQSFYSGTYQQRRGRWLEDRIAGLCNESFQPGRFTTISPIRTQTEGAMLGLNRT